MNYVPLMCGKFTPFPLLNIEIRRNHFSCHFFRLVSLTTLCIRCGRPGLISSTLTLNKSWKHWKVIGNGMHQKFRIHPRTIMRLEMFKFFLSYTIDIKNILEYLSDTQGPIGIIYE